MELDELQHFQAVFFDEAGDHVRTLEDRLLELESHPDDNELLGALFRAAHSIKGSSGALGFEVIGKLTHAMENVLEGLRSGRLRSSPQLTTALLDATDLLSRCIEAARTKRPNPPIEVHVRRLGELAPSAEAGEAPAVPAGPAVLRRWTIAFRPHAQVFEFGIEPTLVLRELMSLGQGEVEALTDRLPALSELNPESCYLGWRITLVTEATERRVRDAFLFVEDMCELELSFEPLPSTTGGTLAPAAPAAGDVAVKPPAEPAVAEVHREPAPTLPATTESSTLRVSTEKVDRLVNLVGELVIAQAMVSRTLQAFTLKDLERLKESFGEMERFTKELQDRVMNIRMVPIGSIFGRFRRLTRDLSAQLGKDILLTTSGEDTELDKSMVEALADPLTHLVRNCADHGLETTAERLATGKPRQGHVELSAKHQGGNVVIEVADDGRGLDSERIRAKALERKLIAPDAELSPDEVNELIFAPGFSTAAAVTDLSGRGVGMDVVKRSVQSLKGSVSLFTEQGRGTRFRLTLPLTLAIIDGMAVRVGRSTFIVPLSQVVETLSFTPAAVKRLMRAGEVLDIRGAATPLLRLSRLLGVPDDGSMNSHPLAVVCESQEHAFAMAIDELLGKGHFVIKSIEENFQRLEGLLGATILGDGSVSYILDVHALAGHALKSTGARA